MEIKNAERNESNVENVEQTVQLSFLNVIHIRWGGVQLSSSSFIRVNGSWMTGVLENETFFFDL